MPIASKSLPQLGGNDTASPRLTCGRVMSRTAWPHFASNSEAAAPAGPPPRTTIGETRAI
jgi:hypothetical protein